MNTKDMKKRIFEILETSILTDRTTRYFSIFIISLISLNVLAVILETVQSLQIKFSLFFKLFEIFSVVLFTAEYILRIWSCTTAEKYSHFINGRIKYALTFMSIVDLVSIIPFYLPMLFTFDLRFIRAIRLFRLFRLFKLGRYSDSLKILANVMKSKKEELSITVFIVFLLLVIVSSVMYFVEHSAQPGSFSSIPAAMWWGIATLTTVGYGDMYPVTIFGKVLSSIIAILSIGIFALPTGIIGSGFIEEMNKRKSEKKKCSHCGKIME